MIRENETKYSIYDNIAYEDLTPELQELAIIIGLNPVKKLLANGGGIRVYVPTTLKFANYVKRNIMTWAREAGSIAKLANMMNVSQNWIRKNCPEVIKYFNRIHTGALVD